MRAVNSCLFVPSIELGLGMMRLYPLCLQVNRGRNGGEKEAALQAPGTTGAVASLCFRDQLSLTRVRVPSPTLYLSR